MVFHLAGKDKGSKHGQETETQAEADEAPAGMLMSAKSWLVRNASLESAHDKYGDEFELAYHHFRQGTDIADRQSLWSDYENVGENIMTWYLQRKC